ncbi:MAG: hypothetical protein SFU86_15585 [Pirellulaceae bacterium]|nr:hypothetical protein [Pirellulaceae bacterium]
MLDFEIQRCSRKCRVTGRELAQGEICYSALVAEGAEVVRRDFSAEAWTGPPEGSVGWWKTIVADPNAGRLQWAPNDVMQNYFDRLEADPTAADIRYVLALLMVRRRIARVERTEEDAAGQKTLVVFCPRTEREYRVPECLPSAERAAAIQQQLADLLQMQGSAAPASAANTEAAP